MTGFTILALISLTCFALGATGKAIELHYSNRHTEMDDHLSDMGMLTYIWFIPFGLIFAASAVYAASAGL